MKCKIFWGKPMEAVDTFNKWAKGKALTREVLIHEQIIYVPDDGNRQILMIIVYHPEDPQWDTTDIQAAKDCLTGVIHVLQEQDSGVT
jgi:hypothetical protein